MKNKKLVATLLVATMALSMIGCRIINTGNNIG